MSAGERGQRHVDPGRVRRSARLSVIEHAVRQQPQMNADERGLHHGTTKARPGMSTKDVQRFSPLSSAVPSTRFLPSPFSVFSVVKAVGALVGGYLNPVLTHAWAVSIILVPCAEERGGLSRGRAERKVRSAHPHRLPAR